MLTPNKTRPIASEQENINVRQNKTSKSQKYRRMARKRLFEEGRPRQTTINATSGYIASIIATVNPDHLSTDQANQDILTQLSKSKIHIAGIQETHIPFGGILTLGTYKLITSSTRNAAYTTDVTHRGTHIGGSAIEIRQEMAQRLSVIRRINNRLLLVTLRRQDSHKPLTILVTYAPHHGYKQIEQQTQWRDAQQTIKDIHT